MMGAWRCEQAPPALAAAAVAIPAPALAVGVATVAPAAAAQASTVCEQFQNHGVCDRGRRCAMSHDIDLVVDAVDGCHHWLDGHFCNRHRSRGAGAGAGAGADTGTGAGAGVGGEVAFHSAGFDAFATGFVFAVYQRSLAAAVLREAHNKVYLAGKDIPLRLERSKF
jgi:target of EGR1 protein 1